ncbi:MAG: single-stranded-DNA-specific exonuclease RecJ [Rhodospirillales bacterium]|nr:single-stranded-DNA-specific exonuclease RecJ [Rhodospirillales bacterium]
MAGSALFGVDNSLGNARWVLPPAETALVEKIARQYDLPEIVARLLVQRGVAAESVPSFLNPTLRSDLPDPFCMAGMTAMATDVAEAIAAGRKIGVFADFDVDGATSAALLIRFMRHLGVMTPFYIPDRLAEGYGPSVKAFQALKEQGAEIVLVCDCGITSFDTVAAGREMGLEIIVFDHHEAEDTLPEASHVIDPKRRDDTSGLDMLAACGVVFMACVAINNKLRELGYYRKTGQAEPPLKDWLDIVALGTVCDMVPLVGVNRLLVRHGFAQMARTENPGILALLSVSGVNDAPTPYTAGFVLGPRINAGSRVHEADLGARLLSTDDTEEARNIAFTLNDCNAHRKEIEQQMLAEAEGMIARERLDEQPLILVGDENWHPGLSGLVAGRLKEKYGKPCVVITYAPGETGGMEGRGSGRSVPGVNMGAAFIEARNRGLLTKGGGHAMAAGFTVLPDQLEAFRDFVFDHIGGQLAGQPVISETVVDGVLSVRGAQPDFVRLLGDHVGPFGQAHPEPLFVLPQVCVQKADIVGAGHVRAMISDWEGGSWMKAMAFRAADTPMGQALLNSNRQPLHLVGTFKLDNWGGTEKVEMHVQDAAPAREQVL